MPKIIPIRDLRDTGKISELCNISNEPVFITKNGYGDMVIMSMAVYEERLAQVEMRDKIIEGIKQADENILFDGPGTMKTIGERYGISV